MVEAAAIVSTPPTRPLRSHRSRCRGSKPAAVRRPCASRAESATTTTEKSAASSRFVPVWSSGAANTAALDGNVSIERSTRKRVRAHVRARDLGDERAQVAISQRRQAEIPACAGARPGMQHSAKSSWPTRPSTSSWRRPQLPVTRRIAAASASQQSSLLLPLHINAQNAHPKSPTIFLPRFWCDSRDVIRSRLDRSGDSGVR